MSRLAAAIANYIRAASYITKITSRICISILCTNSDLIHGTEFHGYWSAWSWLVHLPRKLHALWLLRMIVLTTLSTQVIAHRPKQSNISAFSQRLCISKCNWPL